MEVISEADGLFRKARKSNLMGRYAESEHLARQAVGMLDPDDRQCYRRLSGLYIFLGEEDKGIEYLQRDLDGSRKRRDEYMETEGHYGSRFIDADIEGLEITLEELRQGAETVRTDSYMRLGDRAELVAFDLDGTLLEMDGYSWGHITDELGLQEEAAVSEKAFRSGMTDYAEWAGSVLDMYRERGLSRGQMDKIASRLRPVPGATETLNRLKSEGKRIALISGSLDFFLERFFPEGTFDHVYINRISFDEHGKLSGWQATPYGDGGYKAHGLYRLCRPRLDHKRYSINRTVYVGDNDNDIEPAQAAGLSIALNPQTRALSDACDVTVRGDVRGILGHIA